MMGQIIATATTPKGRAVTIESYIRFTCYGDGTQANSIWHMIKYGSVVMAETDDASLSAAPYTRHGENALGEPYTEHSDGGLIEQLKIADRQIDIYEAQGMRFIETGETVATPPTPSF